MIGNGHVAERCVVGDRFTVGHRHWDDTCPDRQLIVFWLVDGSTRANLGRRLIEGQTQHDCAVSLIAAHRAAIVGFPELLLIEDDHAGSVAGADHHPIVRPDMRHWAVLRSVSKSLGPDLRLAAVAGDATTIGRVGGRQAVGTGWISHVLQRIVVELRTDSDELLQQAAATYTHRRAVFVETLAALGVVGLSASGLNVWVPVADEAAVVTAMQHRGYAIRAGSRFRIRTAPGVRVTIASSSGDQLCGAATALADVLTTGSVRRTG